MELPLGVLAVVVVFLLIVFFSAVKVVQEYERGVVFRLGRLLGPRGPGLILLIPFVERMVKVDLRTVTMDIPAQEVITQDNVTIRVNAVAYFRVLDPNAAIVNVADFIRATSQIAQTTLRSVLGQSALDDLLSEREKINQQLARIIDDQTEPWGIKVSVVEVKDVELPQSMQRAMARQAEAEREKRAKIIHAEGEFQASQQLAAAAEVINQNPVTIQLRYLQTLTEIGAEKNTTVVFPLPIDLIGSMLNGTGPSPNGQAPTPARATMPTEPAPEIPVAGDST
jgi:regulator of protease activity HflC (stomatin/prohibitin superfamily)